MVRVKYLSMKNTSISMLFGKSPKITYVCGKCNCVNQSRISIDSIYLGKPYVKCEFCGEINDTGLEFDE